MLCHYTNRLCLERQKKSFLFAHNVFKCFEMYISKKFEIILGVYQKTFLISINFKIDNDYF